MKTLFFSLCTLLLFSAKAQDKQIQTEHGTLTVKTNTESNLDFIDFSVTQWNTIMNGTDQAVSTESGRFPAICTEIPIATRPACISGIGFRCGPIRIFNL